MAEEDDAVEDAGDGDADPLAEEMLKMMEEEGEEGDGGGPQEDVDQMMEQEMLETSGDESENSDLLPGGGGLGGADFGREDIGGDAGSGVSSSVARLMDVPLLVTIELGGAEMTLADVMELGEQSVVELNKSHGEPVDVKVNGKLFARGEVVVVAENFGVRITQLLPGGLSV